TDPLGDQSDMLFGTTWDSPVTSPARPTTRVTNVCPVTAPTVRFLLAKNAPTVWIVWPERFGTSTVPACTVSSTLVWLCTDWPDFGFESRTSPGFRTPGWLMVFTSP